MTMISRANGRVAARRASQQARCISTINSAAAGVQLPSSGATALTSRWSQQQQQQQQQGSHSRTSMLTATVAATAMGMGLMASSTTAPTSCEATPAEGGYAVNPIQNVTALLRLYEEIDKNMEVLTNRMLADLKQRVEKEKKENNGNIKLSPEQLALHMSIEFETTLERVQDAVFRNNYVKKEHVTEAMQRLISSELPGGGKDGKITPAEAEAISNFVSKLGRMRWKVTGSRQPLIPTHQKALIKDDKPSVELAVVLKVMEELIPSLTVEMEVIAKKLLKSGLQEAEHRAQISQEYIKRSGELTAQICAKYKVDLREFQQALIFYHDDADFEQALARLSTEQQQK